jgi:phage terminase small subunit
MNAAMNGQTANLQPAGPGNRRACTHAVYAQLTAADSAEVAAVADELRDALPLPTESDEPIIAVIAAALWRLRKANDVLEKSGLMLGARVHPLVRYVLEAERNLHRMLSSMGATTAAKADLQLTGARAQAIQRPDLAELDDDEFATFQRLAAKAGIVDE